MAIQYWHDPRLSYWAYKVSGNVSWTTFIKNLKRYGYKAA